ncbi:hypothetical protein [Megalodesulfovibrio gigas]|uniref:hypothetical protein n=1 Tax=Megalodesulfovibrio gigas TaxID=879 RepID=UPI000481E27E|nr:hypothetical protein [Megalodesulfovibrio gigas]
MTVVDENDASSFAEISRLREEIERLESEKRAAEQRAQQLRRAENPGAGVYYAQEIFQAQQDKLRLDVEIQLRKNKINRLRLGWDGGELAQPPSFLQ